MDSDASHALDKHDRVYPHYLYDPLMAMITAGDIKPSVVGDMCMQVYAFVEVHRHCDQQEVLDAIKDICGRIADKYGSGDD